MEYFRYLIFFAALGLAVWWFSRSAKPKAASRSDAIRAWVDDFLVKQQQK